MSRQIAFAIFSKVGFPMPAQSRPPAQEHTQVAFVKTQTKRTFEEVVRQIREMIYSGDLKTGDRLPGERDLALELGIGRPALREALRALEANGLVVQRKGRNGGAYIANGMIGAISENMSDLLRISSVTVDELFEVRLITQIGLVPLVCERATALDIEALRENVMEGERLYQSGQDRKRIDTNIEFHILFAKAAHNPVGEMVVRSLADSMRALTQRVGSIPTVNLFDDRMALVNAIAARDEAAAVAAIERILVSTRKMYRKLEAEQTAERKAIRTSGAFTDAD